MFGFGDWIKDLITGLINAEIDLVTSLVMLSLRRLLDFLSASAFHSPDVTVLPQVRYVSGQAQIAANACMGLAVTVAGVLAMARGGAQDQYTVKELLPRVLVGFTAANLATPLISLVIDAANALTVALSAQLDAGNSFAQVRRVVVDTATDPALGLVMLAARTFVMFLIVGLMFTWLARIATLLVLAGTAPVALMCHAFTATEAVASLWWRSLFGTLAVQVLQASALHISVAVLLTPGANLPALGLPNDPTGLLNLLITAFVLLLVWRIPKWLQRNFGVNQNRGMSMMGHIARVVLIQQVMRSVGLAAGGRRPARPAIGPRPPATHLHQHAAAQHMHGHQHMHFHMNPGRSGRNPPPGRQPGGQPPPRSYPYSWGPPGRSGSGGRPHGGRPPLAIGPGPTGTGGSVGAAGGPPSGGGPPRRAPKPDVMPPRRPMWQAYGARPSATGWPTDPPPGGRQWHGQWVEPAARPPTRRRIPALPPATAHQRSATGWPSVPASHRRPQGGHSGQ